ncbi:MAG TPA: VCBS repeat-containing protein [Pirellulales bacterium]
MLIDLSPIFRVATVRAIAFAAILAVTARLPANELATPAFKWAGSGALRVILRVDPTADSSGGADERPADVALDFDDLLRTIAPGRQPDLAGLQVIRHDPQTGEPMAQSRNAFGRGPTDLPFRWYDAAIPYEFPEVEANVSHTDGKLPYVTRTRFGYFYDCVGDWRQGRLAFTYRAGQGPAWYAVYFDLLASGTPPRETPPCGFLGDGLQRCEPRGSSTTGLIHSRVAIGDLDGDGLFDLIVGCARGGAVWYPNRGRRGEPSFASARLLFSDGKPLDVGWSSAPQAVDWDGDGRLDLVVGAEWNRMLLYRNRGTKREPRFEYAGPLTTDDGQPLALPVEPVPEGPDIYKRDYYPVVETVDWDQDGDLDLLAGGYVTGRIYFYRNIAERGQEPRLRLVGPLEADEKPIDVQWAAAPAVADLDADGDLDLITGCMPMTPGSGDFASSEDFLHYFRNDGTPQAPRLHKIPLPRRGTFPVAALASPRIIDFNEDGLLDLVVGAGEQIYLYRNIGTKADPRFEAHADPLSGRWTSALLPLVQMLDWNGDGLLDGSNGPNVYLNSGRGSPGVFESPISLLKPGQKISHLSGMGDDWQFQRLFDLDADGRIDLLDADINGMIWWHRNQGTARAPEFDTPGLRLSQTDGKSVQVGQGRKGFDELQGARATYTVGDFDTDGRPDLVVVDTFGSVRLFRQADSDPHPVFDPPHELGRLPTRGVPYAADWDGDGRLDIVAGSDPAHVYVFTNRGAAEGAIPFGVPEFIPLPQAPYGAGAPIVVADYNGDGDTDLIAHTAYGYTCFYERSFIRAGYAPATVVGIVQSRPSQ